MSLSQLSHMYSVKVGHKWIQEEGRTKSACTSIISWRRARIYIHIYVLVWMRNSQFVISVGIGVDTIKNGEGRGGCSAVVAGDGGGGFLVGLRKRPFDASAIVYNYKQQVLNPEGVLVSPDARSLLSICKIAFSVKS